MRQILIVDDEPNMRETLKILLEKRNYEVTTAEDGKAAIDFLQSNRVDLVVSDLKMPNVDGMGLLSSLKRGGQDIPLVLITAYGTIDAAVEAMKQGATDFITKPFSKDVFCRVVDRVFEMQNRPEQDTGLDPLSAQRNVIFKSEAMRRIMETATRVAFARTPILIVGDSGSGKGVVAQAIHNLGGDNGRPFVAINCPTIPEMLLESELFGYRRGAFTGADTDFAGKVRLSDGGTLFLDEIAEIPLTVQAKLLRLIEEKRFEPLGSTTTVNIDNRVICATNRDLRQLVADQAFRKDLFYRINTVIIEIPPLAKRRADIIPLAMHFLERSANDMQKHIAGLSEQVKQLLLNHRWPGNVRELRNAIERAVLLCRGGQIEPADLPEELQQDQSRATSDEGPVAASVLERMERKTLREVLQSHGGNVTAAARTLGISRSRLRYRLKKYGLTGG